MHKALQTDSPFVRYGTTFATVGRLTANSIMLSSEALYAPPAITSNATGLLFSHTKAGVVAEAAMALGALSIMMTLAALQGNPLKMWMAGVGMMATGNAIAKNIRYTKLCPKAYRLYEQTPATTDMPVAPYTQTVKPQPTKLDKALGALSLAPAVKWCARKLQASDNEKARNFGDNLAEITQRPLFDAGMTAVIGITPFIVDGILHDNWANTIGGSLILLGNLALSTSIPQKQQHPLLAAFDATRDWLVGGKAATNRNFDYTNYGCE